MVSSIENERADQPARESAESTGESTTEAMATSQQARVLDGDYAEWCRWRRMF